jgi:predicted dehydrogenase
MIGSGLIAGKKHIPAFQRVKETADLLAICDLNFEAAKQVAARFGIPKAYGNVAEMLAAEKPDLVDICTPPATHTKVAVQAMQAGANVLIEKPMALTVEDCDRIVDASRQYGVKVCVGHSDLFYEPFMKARALVGNGAIGRFRGMRILLSTPTDYMTSRPEHWAHKLPGGVIGESGPHVVYMTQAFLSGIHTVSVDAVKLMPEFPWSRFEDYRINFIGNEGMSSAMLTYATMQWMARVELLGDEGFLFLDLENMTLEHYSRRELKAVPIGLSLLRESRQRAGAAVTNAMRYLTRGVRSTHEIIISSFVDSIRNGTQPPVTGEEGREAVRLLDLIATQLDQKSVAAVGR